MKSEIINKPKYLDDINLGVDPDSILNAYTFDNIK